MIVTTETNGTAAGGDTLPGLLPHHLRELRASGLSDAMIQAAGIQSETSGDRLAYLLAWRKLPKKMASAIVFPFHGPDGSNGYYRTKHDFPRTIGGKPIKYESPKGRANEVYLPPGVADVLPDAARPLLITEGEKKSLKATQDGFPCIGLVGVYGWKAGRREALLPALERIAWQGRPVYIVFDSDAATKDEIREAESRLAAHLANRGAVVRIVRLPEGQPDASGKPAKVGLDDYLIANGPDGLRKLIADAIEPEGVEGAAMKELAALLDPADEAGKMLAAMEADGVCPLRFWRGDFVHWQRGHYAELPLPEVRANVVRELNKKARGLSCGIVANLLDQLKAQTLLPRNVEPPAWLEAKPGDWPARDCLAAKNGIVHLPSLIAGVDCLRPATPRLFVQNALDYAIDLEAAEPKTWFSFLDSVLSDDSQAVEALQDWFGYCLTPDTTQQKILTLIGPKRSGKGTIGRVLRAVVGPANVCGPTLSGLATNFGLWPLLGKTLAIIPDARLGGRQDQAVIVERLLSISGEDPQTIDRKNLEPVTCILPTRLMLVSNELPRLGDSSGALVGRMILLRLTRTFYGAEDTGLTAKLLTELPGILLWAIAGWQRLRERGRFIQPDSALELLGDMADLASPISVFVRERCIVEPGRMVAVADLYAAWKAWCESKGRKEPGTEQTFGRDMLAAVPGIGRCRPREGDERYRAYDGIGLRDW